MSTNRSPAPGFIHLSPECGARKEPHQEKSAFEKALKQQGTSLHHAADFGNVLEEEEAVCLGPWHTRKPEQKKKLRPQSRRGKALGGKRECQLCEPTSTLCQAPSSKVVKMPRGGSLKLRTEANTPSRVFVALFDYNPLVMSANPRGAEEELAFQKGQLLRVWGSQDPHGFYHGECNGQVGNIPGHLVVEVGTEQTDGSWCLSEQGHLPSVAHLEDFECLTSTQGSILMPQGTSTPWTPKTMVAALDYDPRDGRLGSRAKGKLVLRAGDVVTVYGPVDAKGFYYGESSGHRGLVPAHLLDDLSVHAE
jgi:hypothetical protein